MKETIEAILNAKEGIVLVIGIIRPNIYQAHAEWYRSYDIKEIVDTNIYENEDLELILNQIKKDVEKFE